MVTVSDFGKDIKKALVDRDQTQEWLMEQVRQDTGLYFDSSYLYKVLVGRSRNPKILDSICKILELEVNDGEQSL